MHSPTPFTKCMKTEHIQPNEIEVMQGELTDSILCSFVHYRPRAFARVLRLPFLVATLLNWRSSSKTLLAHLLSTLDDEVDYLEIAHAQLASSLWPTLSIESGKNKLTRWLSGFDEDQYLSRFHAIDRKRGRYVERDGEKEFFPSQYRLSAFYQFAEKIGDAIMNADLLSVEALERRHSDHRAIVGRVLIESGAVAILPEMRAKDAAKKKREDSPKCVSGVASDSWEFQRLPLKDKVEIVLSEMFDVSKRAFSLIGQCETHLEAEQIVSSVLKYQASHAAAALDTHRRRIAEAQKPKSRGRRVAVQPSLPDDFRKGELVAEVLAAARITNEQRA